MVPKTRPPGGQEIGTTGLKVHCRPSHLWSHFLAQKMGAVLGPFFWGWVWLGWVGLGWVGFGFVGLGLIWFGWIAFFDYQTGVITWTLFWVSLLCLPAVYIVFLARMFSNGFLTCVHSHHDVE